MIMPISHRETISVHEWTFENYRKYVAYEAMFYDSCRRVDTAEYSERCKLDASYKLVRSTRGYGGFLVDVECHINLHSADGAVPEFDPELDSVNMSRPAE